MAQTNLDTAMARFRPEHFQARIIPILDAIATGAR
jgi:hypothetical protein